MAFHASAFGRLLGASAFLLALVAASPSYAVQNPCSGTLSSDALVCVNTNNDTGGQVESALEDLYGYAIDLIEIGKVDTGDHSDNHFYSSFSSNQKNGSWSYSGSLTPTYLTVKAGHGFVIYDVSGLLSGDWSTADLSWKTVSHLTLWAGTLPPSQVPEPATLALMLVGLIFMSGWYARRRPAKPAVMA